MNFYKMQQLVENFDDFDTQIQSDELPGRQEYEDRQEYEKDKRRKRLKKQKADKNVNIEPELRSKFEWSFEKFANNSVQNEIIEYLTLQSDHHDPLDIMEFLFAKSYGQSNVHYFIEAKNEINEFVRSPNFAGQSGRWGNIAKGIGGAIKGAVGTAAAGIGGIGGAALGTAGGTMRSASNIATGGGTNAANPNGSLSSTAQGAASGVKAGRGMIGQGLDTMKQAIGNRHQAAMVSAYRQSTTALDAYIKAAQSVPNAQELVPNLNKIKSDLESLSAQISGST